MKTFMRLVVLGLVVAVTLTGCDDQSQQSTQSDWTTQALSNQEEDMIKELYSQQYTVTAEAVHEFTLAASQPHQADLASNQDNNFVITFRCNYCQKEQTVNVTCKNLGCVVFRCNCSKEQDKNLYMNIITEN